MRHNHKKRKSHPDTPFSTAAVLHYYPLNKLFKINNSEITEIKQS